MRPSTGGLTTTLLGQRPGLRPALHLPRRLPELQRPDPPAADEFGRVAIVRSGKFLKQAEVALAVMGEEAILEQFGLLTGETRGAGMCSQIYGRVR